MTEKDKELIKKSMEEETRMLAKLIERRHKKERNATVKNKAMKCIKAALILMSDLAFLGMFTCLALKDTRFMNTTIMIIGGACDCFIMLEIAIVILYLTIGIIKETIAED